MTKPITLLLCGLAFSAASQAAVLTPGQALQRLGAENLPVATRAGMAQSPVYTEIASDGEATLYVFDNASRSGYLLVSADDVAAPLLGYADSGAFDADEMSPEMKWWLGEYSRQIEYARANGVAPYAVTRGDSRTPVAPLIQTKWNQSAPYSNLTPVVNGKHCVTGCVATATAQVMKYWNYPAQATGTATIVNPATGNDDTLNLAAQPFAWDQMLDTYTSGQYTDAQAQAVAYLMKAVGYAVNMIYTTSESSAFSYKAGLALINNFGYNPDMRYCSRTFYEASAWEDLIYNEVAVGRPVLYGGQSTSGGHEFVCDGYSSDGYFHFNWGWGGMSDGYFLLNSLNPDAIGIGGGLGGGFDYAQDIIVGIQPKGVTKTIDLANLIQYGALKATTRNLTLNISVTNPNGSLSSWMNYGFSEVAVNVGVAIEPVSGTGTTQYVEMVKGSIKQPELHEEDNGLSMGLYGLEGRGTAVVPSSLPDGEYKATVVVKEQGPGKWRPVLTLPEDYNYFYFTKSGNTLKNLKVPSNATVTLDNIELLTPLYYNFMVKVSITATNNSDKEMTKGFYPSLYSDGVCQMTGDGIVITIPANTTVTKEFVTEFHPAKGVPAPTGDTPYTLKMFDPNDDSVYDKTLDVIMQISPGAPDFSITRFVIPDAKVSQETFAGRPVNAYGVEGTDAKFEITINNQGTFFGYPLVVAVFQQGDNYAVAQQQFNPMCLLGADESADLTALVNVADLPMNQVYMAALYYMVGNNGQFISSAPLAYFKKVDGSGVAEVATEDAPVKYYNMQGLEVENPEKGMLLIRKQGSKTEKIIY